MAWYPTKMAARTVILAQSRGIRQLESARRINCVPPTFEQAAAVSQFYCFSPMINNIKSFIIMTVIMTAYNNESNVIIKQYRSCARRISRSVTSWPNMARVIKHVAQTDKTLPRFGLVLQLIYVMCYAYKCVAVDVDQLCIHCFVDLMHLLLKQRIYRVFKIKTNLKEFL